MITAKTNTPVICHLRSKLIFYSSFWIDDPENSQIFMGFIKMSHLEWGVNKLMLSQLTKNFKRKRRASDIESFQLSIIQSTVDRAAQVKPIPDHVPSLFFVIFSPTGPITLTAGHSPDDNFNLDEENRKTPTLTKTVHRGTNFIYVAKYY